jgi:hypothetical protein
MRAYERHKKHFFFSDMTYGFRNQPPFAKNGLNLPSSPTPDHSRR